MKLRKWGDWKWWHVFSLVPCLVLWPLVVRDQNLRGRWLRPDRMYWADAWMLSVGWVVAS